MQETTLAFWIIVLSFGAGMAIDIFVTTLSRFHDESLNAWNWAGSLGLSHSILPALSFFLFWTLGEKYPDLQSWLGLFGALLIYLVIYEIVYEEMGEEPLISTTDILNYFLPASKESTRHYILIMSISWDALLCIPALLPHAEKGNWDLTQIIVALVTFGLIAGLTALVTLHVAKGWRKQNFSDVEKLVHYKLRGSFTALFVLGVFGAMAFLAGSLVEKALVWSIIFSFGFMSLIFILNKKALWDLAHKEAKESINGEIED